MDSGATHHFTLDINMLDTVTPFSGSDQVTIVNGKQLYISHPGTAKLPFSYSPLVLHQNMRVERKNRHVVKMGLSLLYLFPLVAPTSLPFFSHFVSPSVPPHFPLPPRVDLHVPSVDTYLLASSRTHNIHPMVTRSKASIYKPKLMLSVSIVMRTSIDTL
ncbi:hypothetical protein AAG906_013393 [Vitis piasezkii]